MNHKKDNSARILGVAVSILLMTLSVWCFVHTILWVLPINIVKYIIVGILLAIVALVLIKRIKLFTAIPVYILLAVLALRLFSAIHMEIHMRYYGTLWEAIHTGNASVVQRRIAKGCDVNKTIGGSPAICAVFQLYSYRSRYEPGPPKKVRNKQIVDILKTLVENGANVDAVDQDRGWSALFWAIAQFNTDAVKLLVGSRADVNLAAKNGYTPLHFAQAPGITRILVAAGASVNTRAHDGNTPLHMASVLGSAQILVSHGADVNAKNKTGKTPLDLAVTEGHEEIADLLVRHGAVEKP
jgi:ankyrin repeat protein